MGLVGLSAQCHGKFMYFDVRAAKLLAPGEVLAVEGCPGLRLVAVKSSKTWTYRYRDVAGRLKQVKLGSWPEMNIQEALGVWTKHRADREAGVDIVEQRKLAKEETKKALLPQTDEVYSVKRLLDDFVDGHLVHVRKPAGFDAVKSAFHRILEANPEFAAMPAEAVTRQVAFGILEGRKVDAPCAAQKLRSNFGGAWDYALDAGRISGETPNWWRSVQKGRLQSKGKKMGGKHIGRRKRYLSDEEIGTLINWLPNMQKIGMDAVIMYLWTGTRGSEIFGMNVDHLAEKNGVLWWTIPKAMTKNARFPDATDLRVPLIGRAREVAERRCREADEDGNLFVGATGNRYSTHTFSGYLYDLQPYSPKSKRKGRVREILPVSDWSAHNLRRTTRTMLSALGCPKEVAEAIVGHMPEKIEGVYNAYSYDAERVHWLGRIDQRMEELAALALPARP